MGIVPRLLVGEVGIGCPVVASAVVAPGVGVALAHNPLGFHTAPVVAIHREVAAVAVHVLDGVGEVGVEGEVLRDVGTQPAVEAGVVAGHHVAGSLLLHGDEAGVEAVDGAAGHEERAPAPYVLVDVAIGVGTAEVAAREVDTGTHSEPVGEVGLQVERGVVALELGRVKLHEVLPRVVAEGCIEGGAAARTAYRHIVRVAGRMVAVPYILDVVVGIVHGLVAVEVVVAHGVHALVGGHGAVALLAAILLLPGLGIGQQLVEVHTEELNRATAGAGLRLEGCLELGGHVGVVGQISSLVPSEVVAVVHSHTVALLALLGGDENHTEGCTGTVDRGRCCILEHRYRGDVLAVDHGQVLDGHAVDHDQGCACAVERAHTAYLYRGLAVDVAARVEDGEAGHCTLQGLGHILLGARGEGLVEVDIGHSAGEVHLLLLAVAHDHHLVEQGVVVGKLDLEVVAGLAGHGLVTDKRHLNVGIAADFE